MRSINSQHQSPIIYELGNEFYDSVLPAKFPKLILRFRNNLAAEKIGLNHLTDEQWLKHFGQFEAIQQNLESPLALRYHGHQFQHYNPDLGDGRGFLFAQLRASDKSFFDLGTKGSGQTPYSRNGDGRLTLKGGVREALATEMLEILGVNTSKTFSLIETGESLMRNDEPSPTRAAVLTRMSLGHIRIGTFQRLHFLKQDANLRKLAEYCVRNYFPEVRLSDSNWPTHFLNRVIERNAELVAEVMCAGFVHGVLNTDNINITGELFDYGPYRFLPTYDPQFVAAYFDHSGLYAYGQQPAIFLWNLQRFAETLKFAFTNLEIEEPLANFSTLFVKFVHSKFLNRLNLKSNGIDEDQYLLAHFFEFMYQSKVPFEQTFFDFFGGVENGRWQRSPQRDFYSNSLFLELQKQFEKYEVANSQLLNHVYFKRESPETLLIDEIESIWSHIDSKDDWGPFHQKIKKIRDCRGIFSR